ncbi:MAG: fibrobacter succinogenes major paralogous domain-containing protein, partial [Bacteroidales bacterium]|nr:fibrobacter succinogenes major paralogous domain-containing protein [Bacteroidales bacterium]
KSLHPDKKILGYASLSVATPIAKVGATGTILFDIDDLYSTTNDGQVIPGIQDDEWMTVWFDASAGASIGLPVTVGCLLLPGQDKNIDPWFAPGASFTVAGCGAAWSYNSIIPSVHFETTIASFSVNLGTFYALDIKKSAVIDILIASIIDNLVPNSLFLEMSDFMYHNFIDLIWLPKEFNPDNDVRHYSVGNGLTFTDSRDEQVYNMVQIGNQTWMAENLNYNCSGSYYYINDPANGDVYGRLYTWDAAMTAAPAGWHLPTDAEWTELTDYLGGQNIAGGKMKEAGTEHWNSPNTGATNGSGFTVLPGGFRDDDNMYGRLSYFTYFWSATEDGSLSAWYRTLGYSNSYVFRCQYDKSYGHSVRCIKD